jgi:hypothetical protein
MEMAIGLDSNVVRVWVFYHKEFPVGWVEVRPSRNRYHRKNPLHPQM